MAKADPVNVEYETRAKNLLKGELKRRGITYGGLAERLARSARPQMLSTMIATRTDRNAIRLCQCGFMLPPDTKRLRLRDVVSSQT